MHRMQSSGESFNMPENWVTAGVIGVSAGCVEPLLAEKAERVSRGDTNGMF